MEFLTDIYPTSTLAAATTAGIVIAALALFYAAGVLSPGGERRRYHPVAGTIFQQLLNFRRLHHYSTRLARRHRTFRLLAPFRREIYTADPANVEYILKTNFANYGKGQYNYNNMKDLLGDGIFAVDGEKWKNQRNVATHEFSRSVLRNYTSSVFKKNSTKLASVISNAATSNSVVDIQDLFMKSTMDSIFQVAFGIELDSLHGSNEEEMIFAEAFDDASVLITRRYVDVLWKIKRFLNIGSEALFRKKIEVVNNFVYKMIRIKIGLISQQQHAPKEDLISRFLVLSDHGPENNGQRYLRDIILNFMIAGKDTTAVTLSWFFYLLCKHPQIEEKVAQEVIVATKDIGLHASIGEFAAHLTDETMSQMHYLHAALTETMRLYPAVPLNPKVCFSDDILPDGFSLRKGDMVAYMPYAMGRMTFIWGDDAEIFRPERWLNDDGLFSPESPFKFTAFQAGPRICLGKEFAYMQMKIFATVLLRFFKFKLDDEKKPAEYRTMLTLQINKGLELHALHRQGK